MKTFIILFVLFLGLSLTQAQLSGFTCTYPASTNGRCGKTWTGEFRCPNPVDSCSQFGWCGSTVFHRIHSLRRYNGAKCGKSVKIIRVHRACKIPVSVNSRCGPKFQTRCPGGPSVFCHRRGHCKVLGSRAAAHKMFRGRICKATRKHIKKSTAKLRVKVVGAKKVPVKKVTKKSSAQKKAKIITARVISINAAAQNEAVRDANRKKAAMQVVVQTESKKLAVAQAKLKK